MSAVPSALEGLTSGFGMGPGGPPPQLSPAPLLFLRSEAALLLLFTYFLLQNRTELKQVKASVY